MDVFPSTIPDILRWRAARAGARPWLFFEGESWTLDAVRERTDHYATGLAERGVVRGDRVAFVLGNRPETLFTWFAANALGAIAVPLNPAFKRPELAALFLLSAPSVVVADEHRALVEAAVADLPDGARPIVIDPHALGSAGKGAPQASVSPDDVAVLLATSGTTGAPKAVAQTHRTYALTAEAFPSWVGLGEDDRLLTTLPLFHVNAQAYSTMGALGAGAGLALVPKFSASRFWQEARRLGATQFNAVGAMIHILLKTASTAEERAHAVRVCYAALALPEAEHRRFEERFGVRMLVGYGMSETTFGTVWPRDVPPKYGSMGVLRQHPRLGAINEARVVRDDGTEAAPDEAGELWLASPATMREYWRDPSATDAVRAGRFLRTGDLVRRDAEGSFTFVARKKDVIRRRGENVAAAEIEGVLASHPGVREAAVVGVASELGEQEIVAYIEAESSNVDLEALLAFCREHLADFKVPSKIVIREKLPRTATERIAKHLLTKES